jgi:hypothetical protein
MAQIKISGLPASAAALAAMQLEVNNAGTSERLTVAQLLGLVGLLATGAGPLLANIDATNAPASLARFDGTTAGTKPSGVATGTVLTVRGAGTNNLSQLVVSGDGTQLWFRACVAGVWGEWRQPTPPELTQLQAGNATSTVFGTVSGQRLLQAIRENLNATGIAPMFACRAWVNFDGTGAVSIRASGNVSSVTDNGTADYTVNFATRMQDADYAVTGSGGGAAADTVIITLYNQTVSAVSFRTYTDGGSRMDRSRVNIAIFR